MSAQSEKNSPPLDEVMLAMDVVDTLRHRQGLVARELDGDNREARLIDRLREVYRNQGIEVPERILKEGVAALEEDRFVYKPPDAGFSRSLARLYVSRGSWGKWVLGIGTATVLFMSAYYFAYLPYRAAQAEAARIELSETMPAQMLSLYGAIFEETKVQSAVTDAQEILKRGRAAAAEGDRAGAQKAIDRLSSLLETLRQSYTLRVVNREGVKSGFWTFPEVNSDATNYYVVVEAIDSEGNALTLPVLNEETGETERVSIWGLRVPERTYKAIGADKTDDGIIQRNMVGRKQYGFLDVNYSIPVSGGAVTRW
ncbi:MAG TPA: hypothetical protein ENJ90_04510 [Devosia sp.]|nr:hypothetical protein [Devosia sp.]